MTTEVKFPTYWLKARSGESSAFYSTASVCADLFLEESKTFSPLVRDYMDFIAIGNIEPLRSKTEYILEFLTLGILLKKYSLPSSQINPVFSSILIRLYQLRKRVFRFKPVIDALRGLLMTLWMNPKRDKDRPQSFEKLLAWLSAAGDYEQETGRLQNWSEYIHQSGNEKEILSDARALCDAFIRIAEPWLCVFMFNLNSFLENNSHRAFREDILFRRRGREEYYLNMIGAELLNRAYRQEFLQRPRKVLILPACMRLKNNSQCAGKQSSIGYVCSHCSSECSVSILSRYGKKNHLEVYFIEHESSLFAKGTEKENIRDKLGVIGVACTLNLLSGGWKVKGFGIPAQCVLLDYSGCKNHWDKNGIQTSISIGKLDKIIGR